MNKPQLPTRIYRDNTRLSILGLGGMTLLGMDTKSAGALIREALDRGINYYDVAPFYGDGEAEQKMGAALASQRSGVFLACKTLERSASGAMRELEQSLRRLGTDHLDLYQFHAVSDLAEVEEILGPKGALSAFLQARKEGKIGYIGFSAHSVEAALALLEGFRFDSVLFPVNFICCARGNFGPQVLAKAKERGTACLAIKAMAHGPWKKKEVRKYPNCWYRPIEGRNLARQALRFTLSQGVTAAIPPGDERLFRMAMDMADDLPPLTAEEMDALISSAKGLRPLLRCRA